MNIINRGFIKMYSCTGCIKCNENLDDTLDSVHKTETLTAAEQQEKTNEHRC